MDINYLVFGGGGVAGYAYAGALQELFKQKQFSTSKLKGIAGTSVGAITGLLVALHYTPQDISKKLIELNLESFADTNCLSMQWIRLFMQYGRYKGKILSQFITALLQEKTGRSDPENITFADLHDLGFIDLSVVATKLYKMNGMPTSKQKIFSYEHTPQTSVALAILASTAAPGFFPGVRLKKIAKGHYVNDENGHLYEDGGILNNYPIEVFDQKKYLPDQSNMDQTPIVNHHTLGLVLSSEPLLKNKPDKNLLNNYHPFEFAESIVNGILAQYENEKLKQPDNDKRTIKINRLGVTLSEFSIGNDMKQQLVLSGIKAVKHYFSHRLSVFKWNTFFTSLFNKKDKKIATFSPSDPKPVNSVSVPQS